jgi:hypothetical protein
MGLLYLYFLGSVQNKIDEEGQISIKRFNIRDGD